LIGQKKYRGFLIDADNTLFDFDRCEQEALYETVSSINKTTDSQMIADYRKINTSLWKEFEEGKISVKSLEQERFRLLLNLRGLKADPGDLSRRYLENLSKKRYFLPHAVAVLEYLSKKAVLGLITNGLAAVQRNRIARTEIEIFFKTILISEEIGMAKPDPEVFLLAARHLQLPPYEILCIGDSPSSDIRGAHTAGMDTCWYSPSDRTYPKDCPSPDYTISDLREIMSFASDAS
jgi:putative hydrolase of the HAD superfamily